MLDGSRQHSAYLKCKFLAVETGGCDFDFLGSLYSLEYARER